MYLQTSDYTHCLFLSLDTDVFFNSDGVPPTLGVGVTPNVFFLFFFFSLSLETVSYCPAASSTLFTSEPVCIAPSST